MSSGEEHRNRDHALRTPQQGMYLGGFGDVALKQDDAAGVNVPSMERSRAETSVPSKPMMSNWPTCSRSSSALVAGIT